MKVTYYLEIMSSWCHWAEPMWMELKRRYGQTVEFTWKIALMNPQDFPVSPAQCDWFYRRSGTIMRSPYMLNSGWLEPDRKGDYTAANFVAEAGKDLGFTDDRLRLVLSNAALRQGAKIGDLAVAAEVAAGALGVDSMKLRQLATSEAVRQRVQAATAEFHALQITQRPAFVLENSIADKAVFSGLVKPEPLIAAIDAMLSDAAAYATHKAHFGGPSPA